MEKTTQCSDKTTFFFQLSARHRRASRGETLLPTFIERHLSWSKMRSATPKMAGDAQ